MLQNNITTQLLKQTVIVLIMTLDLNFHVELLILLQIMNI